MALVPKGSILPEILQKAADFSEITNLLLAARTAHCKDGWKTTPQPCPHVLRIRWTWFIIPYWPKWIKSLWSWVCSKITRLRTKDLQNLFILYFPLDNPIMRFSFFIKTKSRSVGEKYLAFKKIKWSSG